jgi:hypothetical protein
VSEPRLGSALLFALAALALAPSAQAALPDGRGYELVSPVDKNGGQIAQPEALYGGGVLQAAAQGGAVTYGSAFSFGAAQGAPGASQYLSRRGADGWSTENLTVPQVSGGYPREPGSGVPYQLFSGDLSSALLSNGKRCRGEAASCPVANPALPGSGALPGYRDYYRRDDSAGSFAALLGAADLAGLEPQDFEVAFVGASADLGQVILSSCSALTANATEAPGAGGECDPAHQNLYLASASGPVLVNLLPGATRGTPGATLAAPSGAISGDGSHVYFSAEPSPGERNLYLREGGDGVCGIPCAGQTKLVAVGAAFQTAAADGAIAFYTDGPPGHEVLFRYDAATEAGEPLAGEVEGVLGASEDGTRVYYATGSGLFLWDAGAVTEVAAGAGAAEPADFPPATATARVSADGTYLAFQSSLPLSGYDNQGESEVYRYSALSGALLCVSCDTAGKPPLGPSSIPGARANGAAIRAYKPRALTADGSRLFFDSADALVPADTNHEPDVYEWEVKGAGGCAKVAGCVSLISSGRSDEGATFLDASADGADAFFLTDGSLLATDPGAIDVYDARVGGGFPVPVVPTPCVGDACQAVPGEAEDQTPATTLSRPQGNPPVSFPKAHHKKPKKHKHHHKHRHTNRDGR